MKKRTLSFLLALVMCLSLLPVQAFAVYRGLYSNQGLENHFVAYSNLTVEELAGDGTGKGLYGWPVTPVTEDGKPDGSISFNEAWVSWNKDTEVLSFSSTWAWYEFHSADGPFKENGTILLKADVSGNWQKVEGVECRTIAARDWRDDDVSSEACLSVDMKFYSGGQPYDFGFGKYCVLLDIGTDDDKHIITLNDGFVFETGEASEWAKDELARADELGLIPDCLEGEDLTQDITRAEFAAVAVKVYEALSGTPAIPIVNNPFTDCNDVEVLKAYNIGAVNGTSATTYAPDALLTREQAATMLTRVFKKITLAGWTLATDSQFTLPYEKPAPFADDANISGWAKDSVYFMAANKIIEGYQNNFMPKNTTPAQEAEGYANATREQALLIAVRMVENLGK